MESSIKRKKEEASFRIQRRDEKEGRTDLLLDFLPGLFSKVTENQELQSVVDKTVLKVKKRKKNQKS